MARLWRGRAVVIQVRRVSNDDPLIAQERELRQRVLLDEVGMDLARFEREFPAFEQRAERFVALFDHPTGRRVVGCVALLPDYPSEGVGKLMQMAVDPQMQGQRIGRKLAAALESRAFGELGLRELFCHARAPAVAFYEALGWEVEGEPFDEVGIEHRRMRLVNQPPEA